jgi:hypothetical protein
MLYRPRPIPQQTAFSATQREHSLCGRCVVDVVPAVATDFCAAGILLTMRSDRQRSQPRHQLAC